MNSEEVMWRKSLLVLLHGRRLFSSSSAASSGGRRFAALWGNGDFGRLGLGTLDSKWRPTVCPFFSSKGPEEVEGDPLVSVACGGAHTLFLTERGRVFAAGLNNCGQLGIATEKSYSLEPVEVVGIPEKVAQISAGYHHSSAITDDRKLFSWGSNSSGQLGLGKRTASIVSTPTRVDSLLDFNIQVIALGSEHSIAVTDEGNVLSWGSGSSGRLGHGHQSSILGFSFSSSEYTPRLIKKFEGIKVKKVAAGMMHTACISEEGILFVFGEVANNKLGFGGAKSISMPSAVQELPFSEDVACGGYHTSVLTSDGDLYTWGSNENGCLGLGCTNAVRTPEIVKSSLLKPPISKVSCGWKHSAVIAGGYVFTWGWGGANGTFFEEGLSSGGQLGHGDDVDYFAPTIINTGSRVKALHVSCGFNHTGGVFEYNEV